MVVESVRRIDMTILVSGATVSVQKHRDPHLGVLFVPGAWGTPAAALWPGCIWGADNGAFSRFDAIAFVEMLGKLRRLPGCQFVAAPDVVGDAAETVRLFGLWAPMIRAHGFPVALVGQDGLAVDATPWGLLDAFFVGGSTAWKLGGDARELVAYAKARGKWVHMGRVNSRKRIHYAERIGCDSVDGTQFSWFADRWIPKGLSWVRPLPLFQ